MIFALPVFVCELTYTKAVTRLRASSAVAVLMPMATYIVDIEMKTVILCAAFYSLGVFNCAVFAAVYLLHRPRYVAPTLRRANRDRPVPKVVPDWANDKPVDAGIDYKWLGITGSEQE
jgi:hypothetical protein